MDVNLTSVFIHCFRRIFSVPQEMLWREIFRNTWDGQLADDPFPSLSPLCATNKYSTS